MREYLWKSVLEKYNIIKKIYIECEETDPELKTNLQPLNEFRAALDHIMRLIDIELDGSSSDDRFDKEFDKAISHFNRAFYDICDMLSINYRNKIIELLATYDYEVINAVLPTYFSEKKARIEFINREIAGMRNKKSSNENGLPDDFIKYENYITELREFYILLLNSLSSLEEVKRKNSRSDIRSKFIAAFIGAFTTGIVTLAVYFIKLIVEK